MILAAVKAVPAGSKPPAAVSVRISTAERHSFGVWRRGAFVDQDVIPARESRRFGCHAEAGRTRRAA